MGNVLPKQSPLRGQTQWTAQFLAAAELVRRRYVVSFAMGNDTPLADMIVGSPEGGTPFWVDVKGSIRRNGWFIKQKGLLDRLYYILVDISNKREDDSFFVMSQADLTRAVKNYSDSHTVKVGLEKVRLAQVKCYKERWEHLPKPRARI